jgi:phosphinothricin acetyltransferase
MAGQFTIRQAVESDANEIVRIYNWYIRNTTVSFEHEPVEQHEMQQRILDKLTNYDWLIAESDGEIVGYAYYGNFRPRLAYSHTVESTIYLTQSCIGRGWGTQLYSRLIQSASKKGFREMLGVIALPNDASVRLHLKLGFHDAGKLERVGYKFGKYIDVGIWQLPIAI